MHSISTVIFDMDGVIVDSEPRHEQAFLEVFQELGYMPNHGIDFPAYYGSTDRAVWVDFVKLHHPPQSIEELVLKKQERFLQILARDRPIFAEIPALVARLARRYRLGLASGSVRTVIDAVLALQDLRRHFGAVLSVHEVARPKPAPDVFLRTAELLGVKPGECCVIEDSSLGVEGALAAGMQVIAITNTLPAEKLSRATHVVSNYAELEKILVE